VWISETAQTNFGKPSPVLNSRGKLIEPIFHAINALTARLKVDSYRRFQFSDRLAHDMRGSLACIQGYAEMMEDNNHSVELDSFRTYGKKITSQTYRLGKMVEDARMSSAIFENQLNLEFTPLRLGVLLAALVSEAQQMNAREIIYMDDLGECVITSDSYFLREMISRLLDNALSFSNSTISIHTLVNNDQTGSWAKIIVEDHGRGFKDVELAALLQPYDPSKDHKTLPIFRTSMSFYIINAIAERHKGKFSVHSQPGLGTTYTIDLPVEIVKQ
jgi:signal transduction histidine kinase